MTSHSASHFTTVRFLVGRFLRAATTDLVIEPCRKSVQQVRQFVGTAYSIASHCLSSIGEVADGVWQVQSVVGETARVLISATAYITTLALYRRCVVGGSTAMQVVLLLALGWAHIVYQLAAWISTRTFALLRVQRYSTLGQMTSTLDWRDIAVLAPDMVPCVGLPYTMPLSVLRAPAAGPDTSGCGSVEDALVDYPFEPHFFYLPNGMRVHYACVELGGDTAGGSASSHSISSGGSHSINSGGSSTASLAHDSTTTLLMVHGRHTWSYLFRNVMAAVAESMDTSTDSISAPPRLRLIALDLPGFGKSDRVAEDARWYHFDESIGSDSAAAALSFARSADTLANDDVDNATTMPMPIFGGTASPLRTEHEKLHQDQLFVRSGSTLFAMDTGMSGAAHGVPASSTLTVMDTSAAIIALHRFTVAEALKRFRPSVVVAHDYGCEVTLDAVHALANWHGGALEANYIPRVLMIEPLVCTGADLRSDNLLASLLKRACASVIPHSFHVAAVEGARKSRAMPMSMASMKTALGACHDAYRQSIAYNGRRSREASAARELDVSLLLDREEPLAILDDVLVRRVVELVPWLEDGCGVIGDVIGWNRRSFGTWLRDVQAKVDDRIRVRNSIAATTSKPLSATSGNSLYAVGSFSSWYNSFTNSSPMNLDHSDDDDDDDTVGDELPNVMPCFTMRRIPVWTMLSRSTSDHSKASSLAVEANSTRQVYVDWKKLLLDHGQGKLNDPNASDRIIVYSTTASFAPEYEPRAVAQLALSMTELRV